MCETCCKRDGYNRSSASHKHFRAKTSNTYVNLDYDKIISSKRLVGEVYRIQCSLENNNGYVGLTTLDGGAKARFKTHINASRLSSNRETSYLYRAMERHGHKSFTVEVVEVVDYSNRVYDLMLLSSDDKESLYVGLKDIVAEFSEHLASREKYYADLFQTYTTSPSPGGYNMALAGDKPTLGYKHTEEELKKMREAHKLRAPRTEDSKRKTSEALKSLFANATPEQKKMLEDRAKRIGEAQRGRPKKESTKQAIAKTLTGRKDTPEVLARKIASHTEVGKGGHKYIREHKWSGWIVYINNKVYGKFCKTFPTLEEAVAARDAFLSKIQS
jgi:hypothetical protein